MTPQRGAAVGTGAAGAAGRTGPARGGATRIVVTGIVAAVLGVLGTLLAIWRAAGG